MKIRYIVPGPMGKTELGNRELQRRGEKLKAWAFPSTQVEIAAVEKGPASIESMYEEYLAIPETAREVLAAQAAGCDAAIVGCFGDPGLDGFREITDMLVVGPAGASIGLATTLGHRFSILTVTDSIVGALRRLVWEAGALDKLASIRAVDISVIDLNKDHEGSLERMLAAGRGDNRRRRRRCPCSGLHEHGFPGCGRVYDRGAGHSRHQPSQGQPQSYRGPGGL